MSATRRYYRAVSPYVADCAGNYLNCKILACKYREFEIRVANHEVYGLSIVSCRLFLAIGKLLSLEGDREIQQTVVLVIRSHTSHSDSLFVVVMLYWAL